MFSVVCAHALEVQGREGLAGTAQGKAVFPHTGPGSWAASEENGRLPAKCQSHEEMAGDTKMKINIKNGTIAFNSWLQWLLENTALAKSFHDDI